MSFADTGFARFISTPAGRIARIVVGMVLIVAGASLFRTGIGIAMAIVGLIPLAAGTLDVCVIGGLLEGTWSGRVIRARHSPERPRP